MQKTKTNLYFLLLSLLFGLDLSYAAFPIQFGIPEVKIVKEIPHKDRDFAYIIPGKLDTYIYDNEEEYYKGYQRSYYAVTTKKGGWDCIRHYEILANGCIPYFVNLEECDLNTMAFLPRDLIREAMNLQGVSYLNIDHNVFDETRYTEILQELLAHTRKFLTTKSIAQYVLNTVQYSGSGKILFLSCDLAPDYMRCCLLAGLKELLGPLVVDWPKIPHIYTDYTGDLLKLYGKGMSYTRLVEDYPVYRDNIAERIRNKEFEIIIYGSVHRGLLFHDLVRRCYPPEKVAYVCGEDFHHCEYASWPHLFLREFEALR